MNGIPDRLLLYAGRTWYVELKKPGERPTALQRAVAKKIRDHGGVTLWADTYETVGQIIEALVTNADPPRDRPGKDRKDTDGGKGPDAKLDTLSEGGPVCQYPRA